MIYHVTTRQEWEAAKDRGSLTAPSLHSEGFIHCCRLEQFSGVLERYFQGATDLVFLEIDPEQLEARLVEEYSPAGGDIFPHLYGPLNLEAVARVLPSAPIPATSPEASGRSE